jgi:hypothetical protein
MMTDRWLDACLYDGDGRIFLDRDGQIFGDILRCLRSPDFLRGLKQGGGGVDRLRRLRSEADYYGLQDSLVRMIDDVTIGQRLVLEGGCWARVAGGCLARRAEGVQVVGGGPNHEEEEDVDPNTVGDDILDEEENNEDVMDQGDENDEGDDDENEMRNDELVQEEEAAEDQNGDGAQELEEEDENNEEADEDDVDEEVSVQSIHLQFTLSRFDLPIKRPLCRSVPSFI